jgi:hypothetical protein
MLAGTGFQQVLQIFSGVLSQEILASEWGAGFALCDAKKLLSHIRRVLEERRIPTSLAEGEIVEAMAEMPADVKKVLQTLKKHAAIPKRVCKSRPAAKPATPLVTKVPDEPSEP